MISTSSLHSSTRARTTDMDFNLCLFFFILCCGCVYQCSSDTIEQKCKEYSEIPTSPNKPNPHLVWLRLKTDSKITTDCLGTLISDQFVLTHVHCVNEGIDVKKSHVFFNFDDFYGISRIYIHPFWNGDSIYYSNVLIKLSEKVILNSSHRPACIWSNNLYNESTASSVKWMGHDEWTDKFVLPEVEVFTDARCHTLHPNINISHVCHSPVDGVSYANLSPSKGSPLQKSYNQNLHVIGVLSYHFVNTNPVILVASRTSLYQKWIEDIVWPTKLNRFPDSCGQIAPPFKRNLPTPDRRMGSQTTIEGEFPWNAAIFQVTANSKSYVCGGSIITERYVITAAHCVFEIAEGSSSKKHIVYTGIYNIETNNLPGENGIEIDEVILHEKFNRQYLKNDIALIRLKTKIQLNFYVQPICLTDNLDDITVRRGIIPGWELETSAERNEILQKSSLSPKTKCMCSDYDIGFEQKYLHDENFCAAYYKEEETCTVHSGSGMAHENGDGKWFLKGIVSIGHHLSNTTIHCDTSKYILLTDVTKYYKWIDDKLNEFGN